MNPERVLGIIKPHAVRHRLAILRRLHISGFHVLQVGVIDLSPVIRLLIGNFLDSSAQERCVKLSVDQASTLLDCKKPDEEVASLTSGPLLALCLSREHAISSWQDLMGPESVAAAKQSAPSSLRALYGESVDEGKNAVYGSASQDDAERELQFFFPNRECLTGHKSSIYPSDNSPLSLVPFLRAVSREPPADVEEINNYLFAVIYQPLTNALYEMSKAKPDDPLQWLARYMLAYNVSQPRSMK